MKLVWNFKKPSSFHTFSNLLRSSIFWGKISFSFFCMLSACSCSKRILWQLLACKEDPRDICQNNQTHTLLHYNIIIPLENRLYFDTFIHINKSWLTHFQFGFSFKYICMKYVRNKFFLLKDFGIANLKKLKGFMVIIIQSRKKLFWKKKLYFR